MTTSARWNTKSGTPWDSSAASTSSTPTILASKTRSSHRSISSGSRLPVSGLRKRPPPPGVVVPVADFAFGKPVVDNISRNALLFPYDGGLTTIENFATGAAHGGQQASHFLYTGFSTDPALMFSNQSKGTEINFSDKDIAAFDVIGYDPKLLSVPEPGAIALLALGLPVLIWNHRRKKKFSSTLRN